MTQKSPFQHGWAKWSGSVTITGATTGIIVPRRGVPIYSGLTTNSGTTSITDSGAAWTASAWIGYDVYIVDGAAAGTVRTITANTSTALTFATATDPGTGVKYEIRKSIGMGKPVVVATSGASASTSILTAATGTQWTASQWEGFDLRIRSVSTTASGGSHTTTQTNTANLTASAYIGATMTMVTGPNAGLSKTVTANTTTALTTTAWANGANADTNIFTLTPVIPEVRHINASTVTTLTVAPVFTNSHIFTADYDILVPSMFRPVITALTLSCTASTTAGTVAIRSLVGDETDLTQATAIGRTLATYQVAVGVNNVSVLGIEMPGMRSGNVEIKTTGIGGSSETTVYAEGYWIAPDYPFSE